MSHGGLDYCYTSYPWASINPNLVVYMILVTVNHLSGKKNILKAINETKLKIYVMHRCSVQDSLDHWPKTIRGDQLFLESRCVELLSQVTLWPVSLLVCITVTDCSVITQVKEHVLLIRIWRRKKENPFSIAPGLIPTFNYLCFVYRCCVDRPLSITCSPCRITPRVSEKRSFSVCFYTLPPN